jgi:two-component system phosphoglycerate transport system response regulator PgtA
MPNNILLVDDDEDLLKSFQLLLELQGHTVNAVANPYTALQIMKEKEVNLAILDYNLPYMTGTQLGHLIKKIKKSTPIMFISGNPEIHEIAKRVKYDVCTVLSKPINPDLLIQSVDITLSGTVTSISPKMVAVKEPNQVTRLINNITKLLLPGVNYIIQ